MCNLYSMTKNQDAIRNLFKVSHDRTGNMPPLPGIFPDMLAPVVRTSRDGERVLEMMAMGFPAATERGPAAGDQRAQHGLGLLEGLARAAVPLPCASNIVLRVDRQSTEVTHWFAIDESRPVFAFAGIWRPWTGARGPKSAPIEGEHLLYSILTTAANDLVRPIHAKAMPVVLTTECEWDRWLAAPVEEALELQRPLPADTMRVVMTGEKEDAVAA